MYVSRYTKSRIKKIIIALLVLAGLCLAIAIYANFTINKKNISAMDKKEMNYDADGPFILIDKDHNLIGYYYDYQAIKHDKFDASKFKVGIYYILIEDQFNVLLSSKTGDYEVNNWEMENNPEFQKTFPNGTPVLIYSK